MKHADLMKGSISRGLFNFAVPILCTNVLQSLNGLVNALLVGRYLGEAALTAVINAQSVIFLLTAAALGITAAATIQIGQCIGANNIVEAKRIIGTSLSFFVSISVGIALLGFMLSESLMMFMDLPAESVSFATAYMRVIFLAIPSIYMHAFVLSVVLSAGDSRTPLCFMLLSVVITTVLSQIFIFGIGPIPEGGVAGAALATFVGQAVSLAALIVYLYRIPHSLCLRKHDLAMLRIDMVIVRALVRKGLPIGAQAVVISFSWVLMMVLVNRFGIDTIAAFGASLQLWTYIQMPSIAVGMAATMMAAMNMGGQQWGRVKAVARVGVVYSILVTGLAVLIFHAFDYHLYLLFLPSDSRALAIAQHMSAVVAWSYVLLGISGVLFGVMRATGAVMVPLFVQILSLLVVRFTLAAVLIDRWQADAIWWSFPISSALGVLLAALYFKYGRWRMARPSSTFA